jgi:hypothetical protein
MGRCRNASETEHCRADESLAKALAPEEIRRGDFVAPLYVIGEWPSWYWDDDALHSREEPVRVRLTPFDEARPLKVRRVCLPFVLVRTPAGEERTLDVRRFRLARLHRKFAGAAWRAYRKAAKRERRSRLKAAT